MPTAVALPGVGLTELENRFAFSSVAFVLCCVCIVPVSCLSHACVCDCCLRLRIRVRACLYVCMGYVLMYVFVGASSCLCPCVRAHTPDARI